MTRQAAYNQLTRLESFAQQSKFRFHVTDVQGKWLKIESRDRGFLYSYDGEDVDYNQALALIENR